jgi:hypothetical protein
VRDIKLVVPSSHPFVAKTKSPSVNTLHLKLIQVGKPVQRAVHRDRGGIHVKVV